MPNVEDIGISHLQGDGDFRNKECIELLMKSDIVGYQSAFFALS